MECYDTPSWDQFSLQFSFLHYLISKKSPAMRMTNSRWWRIGTDPSSQNENLIEKNHFMADAVLNGGK